LLGADGAKGRALWIRAEGIASGTVNDDTIVRFIRGASEAGASPGSNTLNRGVAGRMRSLAIPRATKRDTLKKKILVVSDQAQYTSWRACYGWVPR